MKIIDLLNKIANGDIPKNIKYKDLEYRACGNGISSFTDYVNDDDRYCFSAYIDVKTLNDEVEIIEEEKKIPEKLGDFDLTTYNRDDEDLGLKLNYTGVSNTFNDVYFKINEIIDYLKNKGE